MSIGKSERLKEMIDNYGNLCYRRGENYGRSPSHLDVIAAEQEINNLIDTPIDMVLHCPACHAQHIDAPEETDPATWTEERYGNWTNPPHRSHLCHVCAHVWRPADVPTNGVAAVKTKGKDDK